MTSASAEVLYQDSFDSDSLGINIDGVGGGAANRTVQASGWTDDGDATWVPSGTSNEQRALLYSENTFQSDTGFKLTVHYTVGDLTGHSFSFGLIRSDANLSTYTAYNPFLVEPSVYSIGANLSSEGRSSVRGLNFTDGSTSILLDESGTRGEFVTGESTEVTIEIGIGGYWCYRINGVYEASGILLEGFDLTDHYHVVVYGQGDSGGGKSIQSLKLETAYAAGERAAGMRGNWNAGEGALAQIKDFKTLDTLGTRFTDGASLSAQHYAPHKFLETIALEAGIDFVVAPSWGDLNLDEPENDAFLANILDFRAAGFKVKAYSNSEHFVGSNQDHLQEFVDRWMDYCDTDPEVQAFINSQPYHTGVWDRTTQRYEDASNKYPNRKYMFCYAEYVLKDYSLRYGKYLDSWIFDDGGTMGQNGDSQTSGIVEEQRIYQAFANAVHAGNPEIPIAFNNGRSTVKYASFPFAHAVRFEDFTFGHAFGGNNDHASKTGSQFNNNYKHVARMTATDGYVHAGGAWQWDDLIVGNFHSKLSTTSWKYGGNQAWEEADFFQWNLEAMQAGGHMTWGGSIPRSGSVPVLYGWAYDLLKGLDDHLAQYESPGAPNWTRAHTLLPEATIGQAYYHVLEEEKHFWDPEGDEITSITAVEGAPAWLNIWQDPITHRHWILSGLPTESSATELRFSLQVEDVYGLSGSREVILQVNENPVNRTPEVPGQPFWVSDSINLPAANAYDEYSTTLLRGRDFEDVDGDPLTMTKVNGAAWLTLEELAPDIWQLNGTPSATDAGLNVVQLSLSDGTITVTEALTIDVTAPRFLAMERNSIKGGANWTNLESADEDEDLVYNNSGKNYDYRAVTYSSQSFQSSGGFRLTVYYTTGTIEDSLAHNFSFGLISTETDLSTYSGFNPFKAETNVYSLGVNLTADGDDSARGLTFTDGSTRRTLDRSGTNVQFATGASTPVVIEIDSGGAWTYSIDGITEAAGVIASGFDLSKSYRVVFYGQDDNGGGKSIQSMSLELKTPQGRR
ncbi:hypothetical protein ACFL6U_15535 [Planctomycetota bacterium]